MKTTALILLLTGIGLWAQLPLRAASDTATEDTTLREALHQVTTPHTNPPSVTTAAGQRRVSAKTKASLSEPGYAPQPESILTEPAGDAPMPGTPAAPPAPARVAPATSVAAIPPAPQPEPAPVETEAASTPPPVVTADESEIPAKVEKRPARVAQLPNSRRTAPAPARAAEPTEEIIAAGQINFSAAELNQVLNLYSELVNRTILRSPGLPNPNIVLKSQTAFTRAEAVEALNAVLALNGISMINIGEKFVKAVPVAQADGAGAIISRGEGETLPEMGQHVTQIVQLKYARLTDVVPVLQAFSNTKSVLPIESTGIVVIRDYAENVRRMLELIKEIDIPSQTDFISEVIPIKYALASDIANALSSVSGQGSSAPTSVGANATRANTAAGGGAANRLGTTANRPGYQANQPAAGTPSSTANFSGRLQAIINRAASSGDVQILGQTKIIADERTNSLLIFATKQDLEMIKDIVSKLDVVLAQVLIEAIIMEVSLGDNRDIGLSYLEHPKTHGDLSYAGALNNVGFLSPANFIAAGVSNVVSAPGGFSYVTSFGNDLDVTMTAIAGDSRVNVLSRPSIQTSHAVPATLFIGDTVPYITGTTYGDYNGTSSRSVYEQKSVGINLEVTPLINPDGLVVMDISQDIEQLGPSTSIDGNNVPTTTKRTASAKIAVKDRQTVILGGFISNTKSTTRSGIPLLKDIPLLGYLFRSTGDLNKRVELIVMMRPTVLPTPEAAADMATFKKNQMPGVRNAEADEAKENARLLRKTHRKSDDLESNYNEPPPAQ